MHQYFLLNKPYGYLSQFISNDKKERNKKFLGELYKFPLKTMAVGRLDLKSEGLLLLTTDGQLSSRITSSAIEKEYYVQVDGDISHDAIIMLQKGVEIGFSGKKYITKSCLVKKLKDIPEFPNRSKRIRDKRHGPTSWLSITLTEGKFKQVRKMTAAVGYPTLRLIRVRIGNIKLGSLEVGEVRKVHELSISP